MAKVVSGALLAAFLCGCAHVDSMAQDALEGHVEYMKRAAEADRETWNTMKAEAERRAEQSSLAAKIQLGFLLTSPGESPPHVRRGQRILEDVLAKETELDPGVRQLIEIRLNEAAMRYALRMELKDIKGKIEELMSIESSMEEERIKSEQRPR